MPAPARNTYLQNKVDQENREVIDMVFCNVLLGSDFMCRLYTVDVYRYKTIESI